MKIRWFPITAALAAADQAAKCYAENKLAKGEERAITDKVVLRHVQNEGVCMSLLEDEPETARILAGSASGAVFLFRFLFGFYVFQISDTFRFCFFLLFRARSKQFCHHCNDSSCCDKEIREIICDPFQMFIFQAKSHIIYNVSANEPIEHITDRACRHQ